MKEVSLVGFGSHVQKNILPAFNRSDKIKIEAVYVRDPAKYCDLARFWGVQVKAIDRLAVSSAPWVYVSTPISTHYQIAYACLQAGKNVICEKPLTENVKKTIELFNYAKEKGAVLREVCMYQHHKQYEHLYSKVKEEKAHMKTFKSKFTIPHLQMNNVRYQKSLGGGALLDVGYYPISITVDLFGKPKGVKSYIYSEAAFEVDLLGSLILDYGDFSTLAEWGIGLPYSNQATILTNSREYHYDRIFSKPENFETTVIRKEGFVEDSIIIGKDDQFVNFLESTINDDFSDRCFRTTVETAEIMRKIHEDFVTG